MDKYDCIRVLEPPRIGQHFQLYVSDINDPLDFYYQICSPEHSSALHEMMINLKWVSFYVISPSLAYVVYVFFSKFYKNTTEDYSMTEGIMKNGQYLAAPYNDYYHRAFIKEIWENNILQVMKNSFDAYITVQLLSINFLLPNFSNYWRAS